MIEIVGPAMRIDAVFYEPNQATPIRAAAASSDKTSPPPMSASDLEQAIREALRKQFPITAPLGLPSGDEPFLEEIYPETREAIYSRGGKFWKSPFLVNADRSVTLGVAVPVIQAWVAAAGGSRGPTWRSEDGTELSVMGVLHRRLLAQAVEEFHAPLKAAGDARPEILEIRSASAIVQFQGELHEMPILFEGPRCWISSGRPVERVGSTFSARSDLVGVAENALAMAVQAALCAKGREAPFGECLVQASRVLATPPAEGPKRFPEFLNALFSASTPADPGRTGGRGTR